MRTWIRLKAERACGRCGKRWPEGTAMMELTIIGTTRRLLRCPECWGSPAPPDLPAQMKTKAESDVMQRLNEILQLLPFPERA